MQQTTIRTYREAQSLQPAGASFEFAPHPKIRFPEVDLPIKNKSNLKLTFTIRMSGNFSLGGLETSEYFDQ